MPYLYILKSTLTGRFYIGTTGDARRRLDEHNSGKSNSTKAHRPTPLVHTEVFPTLSQARQRERHLKRMKSRVYLKGVVQSG